MYNEGIEEKFPLISFYLLLLLVSQLETQSPKRENLSLSHHVRASPPTCMKKFVPTRDTLMPPIPGLTTSGRLDLNKSLTIIQHNGSSY